jgi:hypothetical protein
MMETKTQRRSEWTSGRSEDGLILYHRRDKSKVSKTATQFVKFMGCLRCRCSAKKLKADDDENIKLKTED